MSGRRSYLGAATDAILEYWLAGTHDADMAEWWTTDEAVDAAGEMFSAVMDEWERKGLCLPWTEETNE